MAGKDKTVKGRSKQDSDVSGSVARSTGTSGSYTVAESPTASFNEVNKYDEQDSEEAPLEETKRSRASRLWAKRPGFLRWGKKQDIDFGQIKLIESQLTKDGYSNNDKDLLDALNATWKSIGFESDLNKASRNGIPQKKWIANLEKFQKEWR